MTIHVIPTSTDPLVADYVQRTTLDGSEYVLRLRWNQREARWYLDLSDTNGDIIASSIKVVANWPLLRHVSDPRRPPGDLLASDKTGGGDPGLEDLGGRVLLLYLDAAEVAELQA